MKERNVTKVVKGQRTMDGAGVKLVRVLSHGDTRDIDPFLMLDAFDSTNPQDYIKGFPMHPHRGIETFTYLLEGTMEHRDTLGNEGSIRGGEAQWMNSGSGILHEEMPVSSPRLFGLQLWINLPAQHKMAKPTYHDIHAQDMPVIQHNGALVRVAAGKYQDAQGPQGQYVQPLILDVTLQPGAAFSLALPPEDSLFIYMLEGQAAFGPEAREIAAHTAALFGLGDTLSVHAGAEHARFVLFSGIPLKEPIAWGGPVVMNTQQELQQAFEELEAGTFIKH